MMSKDDFRGALGGLLEQCGFKVVNGQVVNPAGGAQRNESPVVLSGDSDDGEGDDAGNADDADDADADASAARH